MELILVAVHRVLLWVRKIARDWEWRARLRCPRCSAGVATIGSGKRPCVWRLGYFR